MNNVTRILIVEDQPADYELAQREIRKAIPNCQFDRVEKEAEFLKALRNFQPNVILSDYKLPQFDGMKVLELIQQQPFFTPVIIWTGAISEEIAVECMKRGASNYVVKKNNHRLGSAVSHALQEREQILERKHAQEKFEAIFENSPMGLFQSTPQGRYIHVNASMARIYGYDSPQEMIETITDIASQIYVDPNERKRFEQLLRKNVSLDNFETRSVRKDGSAFWTSTSARTVRDETGEILYYEGFLQDITDRKLAEEKLWDSEARYHGIFENAQDGIFIETFEGAILDVNPRACEIYGYTREEFLQKKVVDIVPSRDYIVNLPDAHLVPGHAIETVNVRSNGEHFPVELSGSLYKLGDRLLFLIILRDITERKKAEEQLRKQEQRFRALIENGMDNISLLTKDGTLLWENPAVNSTLGYDYNEFVDRNIFELMHPDDMTWTSELFAKVVQEPGSQQRGVFRLKHHDGSWRWMEATATNMLDQPSVNAVVINYRDVTERRNAEEELRESQIKYQNLVETSHDLIWSVNADGHITFINHAAKEIYGYEPEELIGRSFLELLDPEVNFGMQNFNDTAGDANEYHGIESLVRHKDGRRFVLSANSIVLRDEHGNITGVTGTSRNITKRKEAEEALRDERNLLRILIDNLPDRIYAMDKQGRKTLSNNADWKACGQKTMEEVIGKTDFDLYPPELAELFWQSDQAVLDSGKPLINFEEPGLDFEGNHVSILTTKIPLRDEEGNVVGLVGVGRDITERKQAEAQINDLFSLNEKILNYSPLGILTYKLSGECVFANEKAASIIGSNVANLRLQNFHSIESWKKSGLYALVQKAITTKTVVMGDVHHISTFGKDVWLTAHCVTFTFSGEEHVLLSILDITERKQAERELRDSEERFRLLFENSGEAILITQTDGTILSANPEACRMFGRDEEEIKKIGRTGIADPGDLRLSSAIEQRNKTGQFKGELRLLRKDGSLFPADVSTNIFADSSGNQKTSMTIRDITERKRAEEFLRESEARFSSAFEFAPIGIALVALDGKWIKVNQALCKLLGYTEYELSTKTFQEITHPDDLSLDLHFVEQTLQGKIISYQIEKRYIHKSGKVVWALLSVSLVRDASSKPQYFISQIQDITERKQAEVEIHRRAQETSALLETSLALTNLDLKVILQTVGNSAKSLFAADGCRVFLMQPDGETLRCFLAIQENAVAFSDLKIKVGEGVTGAVAASGKAEIVNEMQNDPRAIQVAGTDEEKESIMFAPLKERDHTIGVLSIRRAGEGRPFEPVDLELLEAFASIAASAVSNARLFEEAQQRLDELEAIYENGLAVGQLLEPAEIGNRIIETFARYLSWHHVTIRLLRPETDDLEVIAFNLPGLDEDQKLEMEHHFNQMVSKSGQGLSGWVVESGTPLRTGNVRANLKYVDTQAGIRSGLYMPLKIGERIIGVISVESEASDAFTEQDERLLATLASQAAVAFENARLYQTAHQELLERTRAQAALWASETHYRELADSITDILFELDYNLTYTHWNKASEMFSGIPAEEAIGKPIQEVWGASAEQLKREEIYRDVLKERQARIFETTVFPRGQKRVLEIHAYPSTRGVSVVARDITERKLDETLTQKRVELMEYSVHHSLEELMQRAVDEISDITDSHIGFLHFIEEDQKTINLQIWSTETVQVLGSIEAKDTHHPLDAAGTWADALRQRQSIIHNDFETLSDKKGLPGDHLKLARELVIPIVRDERVTALLGIGNKPEAYTQHDMDITERFADYAWDIIERRQMEAALADERNQLAKRVEERTADLSRANSNLARALRVKDEFLANMSHELRTPLNAILGLSESLSEQVAGPLNEKQQKYLSTINESGHHLLSLINDILDLAKIEAGQITLDINKVDVNSVCQASMRMIKQLAQKKNQEVLFEIDSDVGLMWADERRLKQMIVNLLSNAVKFTPESGQLGLEVHGDQAGNRVLITVWDRGIGISNQDIDRLFKPFVQLDSGLAREATGTGLGLALVAQMARLHGGSVSVESQVGEGSRFTILLPWEPALAMDASTRLRNTGKFRAIDPNSTNRPTILLIEDTREVVMMLADYLEMSGFKMVTAQDGNDGIQQAKLSHPDLILMDVMMPGMDGFETTRRLRMDTQFKDTPIIALTALAMPNDRQRCLDAGMDEYISKPVNLKALVKLIRSILLEKEDTKST